MGLFSKFKSAPSDTRAAGGKPGAKAGATSDADIVREARTSARRRLIGAALLLGIGIIGFPLLFETQPRPIPVDIQIEIPPRDGAAPLAAPSARAASMQGSPQASLPAETGNASGMVEREVVEPALPPTRSAPVEEPVATAAAPRPAEPRPVAKPAEKAAEKPAAKPAEPLAEKPNAIATDEGRFVVQIGAFAEAKGAREARMRVERMGLKTYTQVIESATGRRIRVRVGPYPNKAEAEKAASKIKSAGLQAAILLL